MIESLMDHAPTITLILLGIIVCSLHHSAYIMGFDSLF